MIATVGAELPTELPIEFSVEASSETSVVQSAALATSEHLLLLPVKASTGFPTLLGASLV